ncbi:MAG: acyl carrier protein [Tannerellaceae bacterium]|nr:acyl carrier protein [Tannerellaceae bacterium]
MSRQDITVKLQEIFREVFYDDNLEISEDMTAAAVEEWDSLNHLTLIATIEDEFSMKFTLDQVMGMKNVGEMINVIEKALQ